MYETDFVRTLCQNIANQKDPVKVEELISLLRAVIKDDQEEIRIRMLFLAKKYPITDGTPEPSV